jgi:RNA polymerase-binding transcription factor DksA
VEPTDLDKARRRLAEARAEAEAGARRLLESGLSMSLRESVQELSTYDNEPADIASETFEREKDFGLLDARKARLGDIAAAEARLRDGAYGRCLGCGGPVGEARLEALPWADRCAACQEEAEAAAGNASGDANAAVVPMPYGARPEAGHDPVGFDGEDAWQAVARFGTANGPQDDPPAVEPTRAYVDADEDRDTVDPADDIVDPSADTPGQAFAELRRRGDAPAYDPEDGDPAGRRDG